jgi:hypothetical protein
MKNNICYHCKKEIINPYRSCHGNLCRECRCRYEWEKTLIRKIQVVELLGGKCHICGYDKYYGALHLHHIDPEQKEMSWKAMRVCSWEKMIKEVNKCVLICSNCHAEIHAKQIGKLEFEHESQEEIKQKSLEYRQDKICSFCRKQFTSPIWNKDQKFCSVKCSAESQRKVVRPDRNILEQDIKQLSWRAIGRKYGVTDNAARKWAKGYGIDLFTKIPPKIVEKSENWDDIDFLEEK